MKLGIALVPLLLLTACSGRSTDAPASTAARSAPLEGFCSWPVVSNPDLLNIAFPDEAATYWGAVLPLPPGSRVRIDGQYPDARYFSFNVYDPAQRPVDAITDFQLEPVNAGANPYRDAGAPPGGDYQAYLVADPPPEQPAPNTLYAGRIALPGGQALPLNPAVVVLYRIYLPQQDSSGGVPLPVLTYESANGATEVFTLSRCEPLPPAGTPPLLNDLVREMNFPAPSQTPSNTPPPVNRFYNLFESGRVLLSGQLGMEIPPNPLTQDGSGGFLSNVDNAYVSALARRNGGDLYVVRARAPGYARTLQDAARGTAPLRYWSLCTNEFASQRYVGCLADDQVPLDGAGYFTLVVSDPDQRPANALPENGIAWLPWGGLYADSLLIYRHMLPHPDFAEAIQNIPYGTPPAEVMGEYFPQIAYCDRATVESAGASAAAVLDACRR